MLENSSVQETESFMSRLREDYKACLGVMAITKRQIVYSVVRVFRLTPNPSMLHERPGHGSSTTRATDLSSRLSLQSSGYDKVELEQFM